MSLRHAALGLLAHGPASGYDLLRIFQQSLANVWPATQSQLYAELGRLADAGLVTVVSEGARGRKEYAVTDAGRAELRHWLTEVEPASVRRSDMLLRVFFLDQVDPADAQTYLRERMAGAIEYHAELERVEGTIPTDGTFGFYGRIALEWGLRYTAMQRDWAEWALGEVAASRTVSAAGEPDAG